jgi:4-hydroxy-tetrahydrodipicolinate reductase
MSPAPLKLAVCGATGRTGSRVAALAAGDPRFHLVARVDRARAAEFEDQAAACAVVVDFSVPEAAVRYAAACARAKVAFVTGTTGLSDVQRAQIAAASRKTAVFAAPNFSRGVALALHLSAEAARLLPGYDAAIVEAHHSAKRDAPSGTALQLARAVQEGRRDAAAVPTSSLRLGGVVGEHAVILAGPEERVEIVHRAESRDLFARGALDAALWTAKRKPGLYGMRDLLGLK